MLFLAWLSLIGCPMGLRQDTPGLLSTNDEFYQLQICRITTQMTNMYAVPLMKNCHVGSKMHNLHFKLLLLPCTQICVKDTLSVAKLGIRQARPTDEFESVLYKCFTRTTAHPYSHLVALQRSKTNQKAKNYIWVHVQVSSQALKLLKILPVRCNTAQDFFKSCTIGHNWRTLKTES